MSLAARGPDGRYGYQDPEKLRDPVAVTCRDCRAPITGTFHRRPRLGPFGRYAVDLCSRCVNPAHDRYSVITSCLCEWCGRAFTVTRACDRARYCTSMCGRRARRERSAMRAESIPTICITCNRPFVPARADACYCSPACRQLAYRQRQGAP